MTVEPLSLLSVAAGLSAALVGGIFFTFSSFVMAGLGRAGPESGMKAMQQINVTVINPLVFTFLFGTGILGMGLAAAALFAAVGQSALLLLAGAVLYVIGCLGVTGTRNVPLNNALERVEAGTPEGAAVWAQYLRRWTFWNHVRTLACIGAAGLILAGAYQM